MRTRRKRSNLFLCFGTADSSEEGSTDSSVGSGDFGQSDTESGEGTEIRRRRKLHRRIVAGIIRSAARFSSLDRSGKLRREVSDESDDRSLRETIRESTDDDNSKADTISSSSSTPSSSSISSFPAPEPELRRRRTVERSDSRKPTEVRRNNGFATGLCLLLVSLSVMVFWGRLYAILWTSTWLFLVRRRETDVKSPETAWESAEVRSRGSDEYEKKRVVLEGLLERNRRI